MHLQENTQNVAQYRPHHMAYSPSKFEVVKCNSLGRDAFTRKYNLWPWRHQTLPSTLYILWSTHLQCLKLLHLTVKEKIQLQETLGTMDPLWYKINTPYFSYEKAGIKIHNNLGNFLRFWIAANFIGHEFENAKHCWHFQIHDQDNFMNAYKRYNYAPAMIMAGALSVTPVRTYVCTYVRPDDVRSLTRIFYIRILWNLVTLFSTSMSSSSWIMVHIAPCFQELWSFVYENSPF